MHRTPTTSLAAALLAVVLAAGCRTGRAVVETSRTDQSARGTVTGTVRGPQESAPVVGRLVVAVNVKTGERLTTRTSTTGGYTLQLAPGEWRIAPELLDGERLVEGPEVVRLSDSDVDSRVDFVVVG